MHLFKIEQNIYNFFNIFFKRTGSSSTKSSGECISARASEARRFWPPLQKIIKTNAIALLPIKNK